MQVKAETISHMGQTAGSSQDCFLSGTYVPDIYSLETAGHHDLVYSQILMTRQTGCFAVISGYGDAVAGKAVARMAAAGLGNETGRLVLLPLPDVETFYRRFGELLDHQIAQAALADPSVMNIHVSSACLCLHGSQALVIGAGECQVFLYRQGQLQLLKPDHALSAVRQKEGGKLDCSSTGPFPIQVQDKFLLSSRELTGSVSEAMIKACLDQPGLHQAAHQLRDEYLSRNGQANITLTLLDLSEATALPNAAPVPEPVQKPQPHPHIEHQSHVHLVVKPKKEIPKQPNFGHLFFWQIIPAWLQFLSLIMLLLLMAFLAWLLFS